MEQCTFPFCDEPATDAMLRYYENRTLESYLCRDHAKQLARKFDKEGLAYRTWPIQ